MARNGFTKKELSLLQNEADERYERMRGGARYRNMDFLIYILSVIMIAFAIRTFLAEPIRVDGDSMIPTLIDGEHMFVEKVSYWYDEPKRGEIIICFYPGYTESCVKRVIGLPGETVRVEGGKIYIDGAALPESAYWTDTIDSAMADVTVGEDEIFVVGDNRNGSKDSRYESVGCIPYSKVLGRVRAVVFPIDKFRGIPEVNY